MAMKFEPVVARKLVELLCSDDGFRENFCADPSSALIDSGLLPIGGVDSVRAHHRCIMVSELASKADILAAQCEIDRMLTHGIGQITPALDAGLSLARRVKLVA
ncbi:hypothetical protein ARC20_01570 [Stenotrophomonas panacihumi]|uniref:Uncharacterized protein n=1 Tax=Stenotrophomonas panacihumi TaxID=676599 RepID=A0A0R0A772_9GAMM|nr:NHLP-related RiPP peptide [Stenotrophomonas panacihumi]KRG40457.1 hypothetical protein ARC20_01570 [Stenotrophomonas panacihumi]PTN54409.1 putative modified peptide [Stenotrophomonas panacihumi]